MPKGKPQIFLPAIQKGYGENWQEGFKKTCEGLTLEEATKCLNEDLNISTSTSTIYNHAKKYNISFKSPTKQRGKKAIVIPSLLLHFKTEDSLKEALLTLKKLAGREIKKITVDINKIAGTNITDSNVYSLLKKYGIPLNEKENLEPDKIIKSNKNLYSEIPKSYEAPPNPDVIPIKFTCQTTGCNHSIGKMIDLKFGLGLRARRCPQCNSFGTYNAQYKNQNGDPTTIILKEIDGIFCEVEETKEKEIVEQ